MTEGTPVSWLMIERGWRVVASDGAEVGRVEEIAGDSTNDIFNGVAVTTGLVPRPKYVPAEEIGRITDGTVSLMIDRATFAQHGEYEEPPTSAQILPDKAGVGTRVEAAVEAPIRGGARHEPFLRRLALRLGELLGIRTRR